MLLSYNWLKEYLEINDSAEVLADKITRSGLEVEEVIKLDKDLSGLVVGYVKEKQKHPDAEKLNVCQVDVGDEVLQIVCGAANVEVGQYVIVAKVGARLPEVKIKKAKLRGVESQGMICSLKELGLSSSLIPKNAQEGIYVFDEKQEIGQDAIKLLGLDDYIIDISITPNRADALSMRGLVYEVAAIYKKEHHFKKALADKTYTPTNLNLEVSSAKCTTYYGQVVRDVEVKSSPLWLQSKLMRAGIRPINNIVDITNYVLLEYGQPMHAFDKDLLGETILVRDAQAGETITTLDGVERTLSAEDLVITDGKQVVALAGVMGGANTEVSHQTKHIVLESAYFNPVSIRRTSSRHALRSDSSSRFEKGIDKKLQQLALERAVELILALCPNAKVEAYVAKSEEVMDTEIILTTDYLNQYIGINLSADEIKTILLSLGFSAQLDGSELKVMVPSRRGDITIKQDIAEEVARLYGYDNIVSTLPKFSKSTKGGLTYKQRMIREIRKMYMNLGFSDTINYSLVSEKEAKDFSLSKTPLVSLLMPMTETHATLRQSQLAGLLNTASYNIARRQNDLKLIELGRVFFGSGDDNIQPEEVFYLSGLLTGKEQITKYLKEERSIDFFLAKGYLEATFDKLGLTEKITYQKASVDNMHPGRTAHIIYQDEVIGLIGQIHPLYAKEKDLNDTYVFEINLDKLLSNKTVKAIYQEVSKYPTVSRDIAILIDKKESYKNIENIILSLNHQLIKQIELFDLYEGIGLPQDKKSIAISVSYNDNEKTLTEEEITKVHNQVLEALKNYGLTIR